MFRLLLCILFFSLYSLTESTCPYGGITAYFTDQCYVYSGLETDWVTAESICRYLGGHLISVTSDRENGYIARVLRSPSRTEFYIGAYVNGHVWEWSDYNVRFDYTNFRGTVTNNTDNVGAMFLTTTFYSEWDILSSNSLKPRTFACQVPNCAFRDLSVMKEEIESFKRVSHYDNVTTYYYFGTVSNQDDYEDAEDECMRIGGHLPSISNAYQNNAVMNAAHKLLRNQSGNKIILGYSNLMNMGFAWSDGNPSSYTNWSFGEPVTVIAGVAWMDLGTGWWNTAAPSAKAHYICALPAYRPNC